MLVKEIIDNEVGRKWEIYKVDNDSYYYKYYEFFQSIGWRFIDQDGGKEQKFYWTKDAIEWEFDIELI